MLPPHWEHAHNHVIMAFRLYYNGDQLDPNFPVPQAPREIIVPSEKPGSPLATLLRLEPGISGHPSFTPAAASAAAAAASSFYPNVAVHHGKPPLGPSHPHHGSTALHHPDDSDHMDVAAMILGESAKEKCPAEERRRILQEVREHLDLLKEFEGSISKEDLSRRKRELFAALPPAPPPAAGATNTSSASSTNAGASGTAAGEAGPPAAAAASETSQSTQPPTKKAKTSFTL